MRFVILSAQFEAPYLCYDSGGVCMKRVLIWAASACAVLFGTAEFVHATHRHAGGQAGQAHAQRQTLPTKSLTEQLQDDHRDMGVPPVDARTDRVWHAIPGLCGWRLDVAESERATRMATDGKRHLVWRLVPPRVRLSMLPADPIYRGPETEKSVALMVNVSWGEEYIPAMLSAFKRANVKATFFIDGKWASAHPDLLRKIAADGHAIGSHGSGHPDFRKLSAAALARQVDGTNDVIARMIGRRPRLIAPPAGSYDDRLVNMAHERGMYTILWTVDTVDWRRPPAQMIVDRVKRGMAPGALILMHPTQSTVEALPQILHMLSVAGFHTKTVEDVVDERPAMMPPSILSPVPTV